NEVKAVIHFPNQKKQVREFYWGSTFQSQVGRTLSIPRHASEIRFFNNLGKETRSITPGATGVSAK
ncbi:MAG TPA: hypothetical protein VFM69_13280, partial [Pricia sp.]|nr:hypothetical protein [Pricia sp.]